MLMCQVLLVVLQLLEQIDFWWQVRVTLWKKHFDFLHLPNHSGHPLILLLKSFLFLRVKSALTGIWQREIVFVRKFISFSSPPFNINLLMLTIVSAKSTKIRDVALCKGGNQGDQWDKCNDVFKVVQPIAWELTSKIMLFTFLRNSNRALVYKNKLFVIIQSCIYRTRGEGDWVIIWLNNLDPNLLNINF